MRISAHENPSRLSQAGLVKESMQFCKLTSLRVNSKLFLLEFPDFLV